MHSTETAPLKVQNDVLLALNQEDYVVVQVILDFSAVFSSIGNAFLLSRLR